MHQNAKQTWQELFRDALAKHRAEEEGKVQREHKRLPPIFAIAFPAPHKGDISVILTDGLDNRKKW